MVYFKKFQLPIINGIQIIQKTMLNPLGTLRILLMKKIFHGNFLIQRKYQQRRNNVYIYIFFNVGIQK